MALRHPALDPMKLQASLKKKDWWFFLKRAYAQNNVNKLVSYRYGLQAGLSNCNKWGKISSIELDVWVIRRIRDIERVMRLILKKKYPSPLDDPKHDPLGYIAKVKAVKRARDREFDDFLRKSSY